MSLPHLGERAAALADGQLGGADRDRALSHIAVCPACRADVEQHRALKVRLGALGSPGASSDLTSRLLALSAPMPAFPGPRPVSPALLSAASAHRSTAARGLPARSLLAGAFALAALGGGAGLAASTGADGPGGGGGRLVNPTLYPVAQPDRVGQVSVLDDPSRLLVAAVSRP